jgi:hypothetical protein
MLPGRSSPPRLGPETYRAALALACTITSSARPGAGAWRRPPRPASGCPPGNCGWYDHCGRARRHEGSNLRRPLTLSTPGTGNGGVGPPTPPSPAEQQAIRPARSVFEQCYVGDLCLHVTKCGPQKQDLTLTCSGSQQCSASRPAKGAQRGGRGVAEQANRHRVFSASKKEFSPSRSTTRATSAPASSRVWGGWRTGVYARGYAWWGGREPSVEVAPTAPGHSAFRKGKVKWTHTGQLVMSAFWATLGARSCSRGRVDPILRQE